MPDRSTGSGSTRAHQHHPYHGSHLGFRSVSSSGETSVKADEEFKVKKEEEAVVDALLNMQSSSASTPASHSTRASKGKVGVTTISDALNLEAMKARIKALERAEKRLKTQLRLKTERFKSLQEEEREVRMELEKAEEMARASERTIQKLKVEADRYRRWWITEYYSLKVALELVPNKDDVEAIASSADDRFRIHSAR